MTEHNDQSLANRQEELERIIQQVRILDAARTISLPAAGIAAAIGAATGASIPLGLLVAAGLGSGVIAAMRHSLVGRKDRAMALAGELRSSGRITDERFEEIMRLLREATEGGGNVTNLSSHK